MFFHQSCTCICSDKWSRTIVLFQVKQPSSGHTLSSTVPPVAPFVFLWSSLPVWALSPAHSQETQRGCRCFPACQISFISFRRPRQSHFSHLSSTTACHGQQPHLDISLEEITHLYFAQAIARCTMITYPSAQCRYLSFCEQYRISPLPLSESFVCLLQPFWFRIAFEPSQFSPTCICEHWTTCKFQLVSIPCKGRGGLGFNICSRVLLTSRQPPPSAGSPSLQPSCISCRRCACQAR